MRPYHESYGSATNVSMGSFKAWRSQLLGYFSDVLPAAVNFHFWRKSGLHDRRGSGFLETPPSPKLTGRKARLQAIESLDVPHIGFAYVGESAPITHHQ